MLRRLIYSGFDFSEYKWTNEYECLPGRSAYGCNKLMYMILMDADPEIIRRWIRFNPRSINEVNSMGDDAFLMLCNKYDRYGIEIIRLAAGKLRIDIKSRMYLQEDRFLSITQSAAIFEELLIRSIDNSPTSSDGHAYLLSLLHHYHKINPICFLMMLTMRPIFNKSSRMQTLLSWRFTLNTADRDGNTALMLACKQNVISISAEPALLLLDARVIIDHRNNNGQNVVDILLTCNEPSNVKIVLEALLDTAIALQLPLASEITLVLEGFSREPVLCEEQLQVIQNSLEEPPVIHNPLENTPDDTNECPICTETLVRRWAIIPCGHTQFCKDCVNKLPIRKCPICRTNIQAHVLLHGI